MPCDVGDKKRSIVVDRNRHRSGKIYSIEDKVLDYFPDYSVKRGEKTIYDVTIKHLLTMQAPYKEKEILGQKSVLAKIGRKLL